MKYDKNHLLSFRDESLGTTDMIRALSGCAQPVSCVVGCVFVSHGGSSTTTPGSWASVRRDSDT